MTNMPNFIAAAPEIFLLMMGCVALLICAFGKRQGASACYYLVQISLLITAVLTLLQFGKPPIITFDNMYVVDNFAVLLKISMTLITFVVFLYSRPYVAEHIKNYQAEYFILGLFSVVGMMVLVSAYSLLSLFLGLELFALPVYSMVALRRDSGISTEAAMKYFVIGSMATGIMLYGMSMVYGATKTVDIASIAQIISTTPLQQQLILVFGLVFVMVGIAFKLGAVPFHMWLPDVYEGAPTSVTLFIATAPKIAALGMAIRLLADAMPGLSIQWQEILIVLSLLSMALGNIVAIVQSNIKRMLAYSAIAHMGYMTLGLLTATSAGYAAATFYIISYAIMSLVAFGILLILSHAGFEVEKIDDLQGLNSRNPWLAFIMLLVMFSMAGIPPLVGFMAKLGVLEALIEVHMVWLAAIALAFAVIGSYYYLKVVKVMYFEEPLSDVAIAWRWDVKIIMSLNAIALLVLGLFPGLLLTLCRAAF